MEREQPSIQGHSVAPLVAAESAPAKYESWQIEYAKMVYGDFTIQIQRYLTYIQRATFWGVGVLLGATGYLTANVKQVPVAGKAILVAAIALFGAHLFFRSFARSRT